MQAPSVTVPATRGDAAAGRQELTRTHTETDSWPARGRRWSKAPPRNDRYVAMLGVIALCMLVGCVLLFLDLSAYPDSEAKGGPAINLPKVERSDAPPRPAGDTPPVGDASATPGT